VRARASYSELITEPFWHLLSWPETHDEAAACPKREEWITSCLGRFRRMLGKPRVRFRTSSVAANQVICQTQKGEVRLRFDQVAYQRRWGVEVFSPKNKLDEKIAAYCLREALDRLMSDWASVNRLTAEWSHDSHSLQQISFTEEQMGNRFELVVLGILNEEEQLARQATLYRDVRTWKDLEIARLGELRKVRIQVKFLANIGQNDMEIARSRWSRRTVVISPVEIARFTEREQEAAVAPWTWREFLESLPHRVYDLQDLASTIYELFYAALERDANGPDEPVASVPPLLRRVVRAYVRERGLEVDRAWRGKEG
jgi:hypothetical protein